MARFDLITDVVGLDVKLGLRLMRKSWGLTLVGGVAMALTIGLGTSIFTLWNTATTTTLPLPDGDRIVAIQSSDAATQQIHRDSSLPDFRRWRELLRSVTDVSAMRLVERTLITPGGASGPISVAEMTASAFRLARVQPVLGRPLLDDDERGGANVVVIGFELWQAGFSSDPAVLGRRLQLDDVYYTVVGVMPEEFAFPVSQRIWIPLRTNPRIIRGTRPPMSSSLPGWLRVSRRRARRRRWWPSGCCRRIVWRRPRTNSLLRPRVVPYVAGLFSMDASRRWTGSMVLLLAALLLLPPCANIGILVYARAVTRREEFATRYALGATRGRIVTQIFVEALVLAAAAGIGRIAPSRASSPSPSGSRELVLPTIGPGNVPFWFDFQSLTDVRCSAWLDWLSSPPQSLVPSQACE